jgi:hypothetical protein
VLRRCLWNSHAQGKHRSRNTAALNLSKEKTEFPLAVPKTNPYYPPRTPIDRVEKTFDLRGG